MSDGKVRVTYRGPYQEAELTDPATGEQVVFDGPGSSAEVSRECAANLAEQAEFSVPGGAGSPTKKELQKRAGELDIEGRSTMTVDELTEAIAAAEGEQAGTEQAEDALQAAQDAESGDAEPEDEE